MQNVLLITTAGETVDRSATLQKFTDGLNTGPVVFHHILIQNVLFKIEQGIFSVSLDGQELHAAYDAIHLRNHDKYADYANALRLYAQEHGIALINVADSQLPYFGKLSQGALLAINGLPTPDLLTIYGNQNLLETLQTSNWEYPFVIKHNEGIRGVDNYLVADESALRDALTQTKPGFLAQPFIANSGELRVLTFGTKQAPLVFQKTAVAGQYLNNTSQGGTAQMMDVTTVPPQMLDDAQRAAQLMGRDIAGVDVILGLDGSHAILEVNSTPAIASGVYLDEKQVAYRQYFTEFATQPDVESISALYLLVGRAQVGGASELSLAAAGEQAGLRVERLIVEDIAFDDIPAMHFEGRNLLYRVRVGDGASSIEAALMTFHSAHLTTIYRPKLRVGSPKRYAETLEQRAAGLPIIPSSYVDATWSASTDQQLTDKVAKLQGFPVLYKTLGMAHGQGVFKLDTVEELKVKITDTLTQSGQALLREYLPEYRHYRIIVVDSQAVAAIEYHKPADDFRTNAMETPEVSAVEMAQLDTAIIDIAVQAVELYASIIGGVDILVDTTKDIPYLAEVNVPCNFSRAENPTGINIGELIIAALVRKAQST